jgi:hypothetical protein
MIEYQNRYSQTDEPDEQGRWARTATYKNMWISKHFINENIHFSASCHFPNANDTANVSFSLKMQRFVSERWNFF